MRMYDRRTLWNPTRVRNFMKEIGLKPTKFEENMVELAKFVKVDIKTFKEMNPIEFGDRVWKYKVAKVGKYHPTRYGECSVARKLLGRDNYEALWSHYVESIRPK